MRGATAKRLRGLAGVTKETQEDRKYEEIPHTQRNKIFKDISGTPLGSLKTATLRLVNNPRSTYKILKSA